MNKLYYMTRIINKGNRKWWETCEQYWKGNINKKYIENKTVNIKMYENNSGIIDDEIKWYYCVKGYRNMETENNNEITWRRTKSAACINV